jgi:outer membrane protein assembly factor BamB
VPINGENREWNVISGPWLQSGYNITGRYNPYTTAPTTAHIVYTKMLNPLGGLIGGDAGSLEFTRAYGFTLVCVMGGRVYYQGPTTQSGTPQLYCMDISTGQQVWSTPAPISVSMGQILDWRSLQSKVENPYLWSFGSTYYMYDAQTGRLLLNFTGALTGTPILEPLHPTALPGTTDGGAIGGGALLIYVSGNTYYSNGTIKGDWVACWNSTKAMQSISNDVHVVSYPTGGSIPWINGIMWNTTEPYVPEGPLLGVGPQPPLAGLGTFGSYALAFRLGSDSMVIFGKTPLYNNATNLSYWPFEAFDADNGNLLWSVNVTNQLPYNPNVFTFQGGALAYGVWTWWQSDTKTLHGMSAATGQELWKSQPMLSDFAAESGATVVPANGLFYVAGYDGYIHCIDPQTGKVLWDAISRLGGEEMPEETYPFSTPTLAGGEVFDTTSKAYEAEPLYRGHLLYAFNMSTGQRVWNISGQMSVAAIADGYLLATNAYDNRLYCFGMGSTATTVTAPMTSITAGDAVVIQGTVTDQTPQFQGTPAISDQWMTPWMEYLVQDYALPTNAQGVPVTIDAIDPNGNYIHLGNANSDTSGAYSYQWTTPNIPGKYTIITTFAGSNSYYGSCGETAAVVLAVVILLMLRKRP